MKTTTHSNQSTSWKIRHRPLSAILLCSLILAGCTSARMQEGAEWLQEPGGPSEQNEPSIEVPQADVYEVTASKANLAFLELEQKSFSQLSTQQAVWYTGLYYTCPPGKKPYLVRAVYGHAGTGVFSLHRLGNNLLVVHQSLGKSTNYQKTALVVNLDYEPEQIYIRVRIAE